MKSIVFAIAVAACVAVALAAPQEDSKVKIAESHKKCIGESGANEDEVKKARGGEWSLENESLQKYAKCYFEEVGVIDASGAFNKDLFLSHAVAKGGGDNKKKAEETIDACLASFKQPYKDDFAFKISKCFLTVLPENQF